MAQKKAKSPTSTKKQNSSLHKKTAPKAPKIPQKNSEAVRFAMTKKHHAETFLKSEKDGKIDRDFIPFCEIIRKTKNYFTSSCCAGRIALVGLEKEERKQESAFHRKWHRSVTPEEVQSAVDAFTGDVLYFKQEPLILHLGARTMDDAREFLTICERIGIRRAGIKVAKEGKFLIEIVGSQNINAPIKEGAMCIAPEYLQYLVHKANEKFAKNKATLDELTTEAKKLK